jgi:hypothetical protein
MTPGELIGNREWLIDDLAASRHLRAQSSKARSRRRVKHRARESDRLAGLVLAARSERESVDSYENVIH